MNYAEQRRNVRIGAMSDHDLLALLVKDADVTEDERIAFLNMQADIRRGVGNTQKYLSVKQRVWAEEVARRVVPFDVSEVPRGKEVPTPPVLQNLPKAPPRRIVR